MIRRRSIAVFSLSFLDVICCGFGAIILIFVLTIGSREKVKIDVLKDLQRVLAAELADLFKLKANKDDLQRTQQRLATLVTDARRTNEVIQALLDQQEQQLQNEKQGHEALLVDLDELKKEIAARQKEPEIKLLPDVKPTPVGLPVGSNYIAIIIDTSGSMRDPNHGGLWPIVIRKINEVLDSYPEIEGLQLLDGDGRFILTGRPNSNPQENWLRDSPELRDRIVRTMRRYNQDSISNPVPGIYNAIRFLHDPADPNMRMGVYVFGDEFIEVADPVIRRLNDLNPADENGNRKVVINAIGFPTTIRYTFSMTNTGLKFANLMRTVTYQHGGAFIALQDL